MHSIRLRFMLLLALLLALLLLLLNTYPAVLTRNAVFHEKQRTLSTRAAALSASLSSLERFNPATVSETLVFFDLSDLDRVVVFDGSGALLYDSGKGASVPDDVRAALGGRVIFRSRFAKGAFHSSIVTPVSDGGAIFGVVLLQEEDEAHAEAIRTVQKHLLWLSLAIAAAALFAGGLFVHRMTRRLRALVSSIRTVAGGNYRFRHSIRGHDEISTLGTEFNELTERLENTEAERRRFVADASHELKTPLAAIRLLSDSILQSPDMDARTTREFVTDIREENNRLQRTTDKLLVLSRLDAQTSQVFAPLDLAVLAQDAIESLHTFAREKNVELQTRLDRDCMVLGSREDMEHIFYNLIDNAIKYNIPGGSVLVRLRAVEAEVILSVEDTGIGIPEADLQNVFDRFYRVDKARSRAGGGSGLGLSIVHSAVLAQGGSIRVAHNKPRGTRFIVCFPRYEEKPT